MNLFYLSKKLEEDRFVSLADFDFTLAIVAFLLQSEFEEVAEGLGLECLDVFSMLLAAFSGCDLLVSFPKRARFSLLPSSAKFANLPVLTCKILCFSTCHATNYNIPNAN